MLPIWLQVDGSHLPYIEGFHVRVSSSGHSDSKTVYSSLSTYCIFSSLLPYTQYRVTVSPFYYTTTSTKRGYLTATMKEDGVSLSQLTISYTSLPIQ